MPFYRITALSMIGLSILLMAIKILFWDYGFNKFLPKTTYDVSVAMSFEGYNEAIRVSTYLPQSDGRQSITEETQSSPGLSFSLESSVGGNRGYWESEMANGKKQISYSYQFSGVSQKFVIDSTLQVKPHYPRIFDQYLEATPEIQVDHSLIDEIYQEIAGNEVHLLPALSAIQAYTGALTPRPFKGVTDALTAARLGEASCNGKSRLFVAHARKAGIPSRLVGGLILENGTKKTSHHWVEV